MTKLTIISYKILFTQISVKLTSMLIFYMCYVYLFSEPIYAETMPVNENDIPNPIHSKTIFYIGMALLSFICLKCGTK